jgi:hypothetical protein
MSLTFLSPLAALLAVAVLVPLAALWAGEARAGAVARALALPPGRRPLGAAAAVAALAALLGLAAAQPVLVAEADRLVRTDAQAYVVVDTTRSMLASGSPGAPTRYDRGVEAALAFRSELGEVPIGIASFTDRVLPHLLPSTDEELFTATLQRAVGIERPPPEGIWDERATTFEALTALATRSFFSPSATRRLAVVVTDGETKPYSVPPVAAVLGRPPGVELLFLHVHAQGERLFEEGGRPDPLYASDPASRRALEELAGEAGGAVFAEDEIGAAAREARRLLGSGPRVPEGRERRKIPLAPWLALAGAVPLAFRLRRRNL